jgi:response regulator RpfG family c-di-GMP phosphodiesterase
MDTGRKILIADDSEINREILRQILGEEYNIITACNGEEAVFAIQKYGTEIDLILLDIIMPKMDGFEVLNLMNKYRWIDDIPVIMISDDNSPSAVHMAYELGVCDYISRPFDEVVVQKRVRNTVMLYARQKKLIGIVADQIYEKEKSSRLMVAILSHIVEFRNGESGLHVLHINTITKTLLNCLVQKTGKYKLTQRDISLIAMASALHDIGKISIPDEILNKPGRLTKEEYEVMKTHSSVGAEMLKSIPFQDEALVKYAYDISRWHHERYDGKGYPDGLVGEQIPIWAQVVSVADVYDALTSERVYKKAYSHEQAMQMIIDGECGAFNPLLLECLQDSAEQIREQVKEGSASSVLGSREDLKDIIYELSVHEELGTTERAYEMLDRERIKSDFITSVTQECVFEYYCRSDILTLSHAASILLGGDESTINPLAKDNLLHGVAREEIDKLTHSICDAPHNNPLVVWNVNYPQMGDFKLYARAVWASDGSDELVSVIGKIVPSA